MTMRPRWVVVAGLVLVLAAGAGGELRGTGAAPLEPVQPLAMQVPVELAWQPESPVQGRLFIVRATVPEGTGVSRLSGSVADEELHFDPTAEGAFESLAAVPVDTEGTLPLSVEATYEDGTTARAAADVPVSPGTFSHERLTVAPRLGGPLDSADQARLEQDQAKAREVARKAHASPRLWDPDVVLPRDDRVTSGFGNGREFNGQVSSRHLGLDLRGSTGDTVVAATRGVVALVDSFLLAGNIVYLNHGAGLLSGYFHLSEALVAVGDTVEAGTPIGRVGATGRVTGPHLHWVVRYGRTSVDPRSLLEVR
jgi:murein DD-endopeptidase MepM/ murein hydrolase activator NlpD